MREYDIRPHQPTYLGMTFERQVPYTCLDCGYKGVGPKRKKRCETCAAAHTREQDRLRSAKYRRRDKRRKAAQRGV